MTEIAAIEKHACPACGAQAEWNPGKQKLVCPFCGTESPYAFDTDGGKVAEIDLLHGAARSAGRGTRLAGRAPQRAVPELQGRHGVRPGAGRPELRVLRFAGARGLRGDQVAHPTAGPAAVQGLADRGPRLHPPLVREQVVRAGRAEDEGARRSAARVSTSRTGRSTRRSTAPGTRRPVTTTTSTRSSATARAARDVGRVRKVRWEPAAGEIDHFFDDEPVPGTTGVDARLLKSVEPFPTTELVPYDTAYLSGHVVEHYQVALAEAATRSREAMEAQLEGAVRRSRSPATRTATSASHPAYSGADVQAHPGAGLAADVHVRGEDLPGGGERLHRRPGRRLPEEPVEDPVRGADRRAGDRSRRAVPELAARPGRRLE